MAEANDEYETNVEEDKSTIKLTDEGTSPLKRQNSKLQQEFFHKAMNYNEEQDDFKQTDHHHDIQEDYQRNDNIETGYFDDQQCDKQNQSVEIHQNWSKNSDYMSEQSNTQVAEASNLSSHIPVTGEFSPVHDVGEQDIVNRHVDYETEHPPVESSQSSPKLSIFLQRLMNSKKISHFLIALFNMLLNDLHSHSFLGYLLIVFGILSESSAPCPQMNVIIGIVVMYLPWKSIGHQVVGAGLCMAILVDIIWLLRPVQMTYGGKFLLNVLIFSRLTLAGCVTMKIWLIFAIYFHLKPSFDKSEKPTGSQTEDRIWLSIKYFFPRNTLPKTPNLSYEVLMRVLAVLWIHFFSGLGLLSLSIITSSSYSHSLQIRDDSLGIQLNIIMLMKSITILCTLGISLMKVNLKQCLQLYGIFALFNDNEGPSKDYFIKYDRHWIKRVKYFKLLDGVVGFYMFLVLTSSIHHGAYFSPGLSFILISTAAISVILDLWTPLLLLVIARCGKVLYILQKKHKNEKKVNPYWPSQLNYFLHEGESESSSSDSSSDGNDSESSVGSKEDIDFTMEEEFVFDVYGVRMKRLWDEYGRAYLMHPESLETYWDSTSDPTKPYPECYMTRECFTALWGSLPVLDGFVCRVNTLPSPEILEQHLAQNYFWIVCDEIDNSTENFRSVYFYGTKPDRCCKFLASFIYSSLTLKLEVSFKCDNENELVEFVKLLQMKTIVGNGYLSNSPIKRTRDMEDTINYTEW